MKKILILGLMLACIVKVRAQKIQYDDTYFTLGVNVKLSTLYTGTAYNTLFGINIAYSHAFAEILALGPHMEILFVKHPKDRGAKPSLYIGPSLKLETSRMFCDYASVDSFPEWTLANALSFLIPVKPFALNYDYQNLFRFSTTMRSKEILYYRTLMHINVDFQEYDTGILGSNKSSLVLGTGVSGIVSGY